MEKNYKNTLLMMNTDFKMKANLPNKEPDVLKMWEDDDIYHQALEQNKGNMDFILHDGPPYANGNIHLGHALNKIIKDFMVRYKTMQGFHSPYIPGWDTHGLPIETALTKKLKVNRKTIPVADFRDMCYEYALKQVNNQREQFKRLGILADWDNPYITLTKDYEAAQIQVFAKMAKLGLIYKGLKPVYWSPSSETALAEAEIEYHDVTSDSIYLAFKVVDGKGLLEKDDELVIWTTTPWTIPANEAICVNSTYVYSIISCMGRRLVIAKDLVNDFTSMLNADYTLIKDVKGRDMEFITYINPMGKICPVCLGNHVTLGDGTTGLVHTAPGYGEDDFFIGKQYGLEIFAPVNDKGVLTEGNGEFSGLYYDKANKAIIISLEDRGILLFKKQIVHSYPHDWRTKKPIIFRATPQWFASIEGMKDDMLTAIKNVKWKPAWGELRLTNMVKDRKEWCISRQRAWGVPIPVFYAEDGTPILDQSVMQHISELFAEHGSGIWFRKEAKDLLPKGFSHPLSPNGIFTKETDIMDVWFDSGSSYYAVLPSRGLPKQADVYFEGSDQYRGWFNSSLSTSVAMTKKAPYKMVISHGFILDNAKQKMSKSIGNVIVPQKVCDEFGADILRLWVASSEYTSDIRVSHDILRKASEAYRKIRNTIRFMLGNLGDYEDKCNRVDYKDMPEIDQYMECKLNYTLKKIYLSFDNYDFDDVYHIILNYMSNDLSAFYFDFTKDVLYIEEENNIARRSIQTVLHDNLEALVRILNIFIPFTCEEIYSQMKEEDRKSSVALLHMIKPTEYENATKLLEKYKKFLNLRNDILKAIENARNEKIIGKSMNADIKMYPTKEVRELLNSIHADLELVFIVSGFSVEPKEIEGEKFDSGIISVSAKKGSTCARCWRIVEHVDENGLCPRCAEVVKNLEGKNE